MKYFTALLFSILIVQAAFAETAIISVNGMVCAFCAQSIKKKVGALKEVSSVDVDLEKKMVTIKFKDGATIPDESLTETITKSGYAVTGIKRE